MIFLTKIVGILLLGVFLTSCSCDDESSKITTEEEQKDNILSVELQLIGSTIEGLTVCKDNNICKRTDRNGLVAFEELGNFTFKVNEINITTLTIEENSSIISPYQFFENNDTLAKATLLLLHAFDKGDDPSDEEVLLSFSPYIPSVTSLQKLLEDNLSFNTDEHNVTIDIENNTIVRDNQPYILEIPTKRAYTQLRGITNFITIASDKNVTLDNIDTPYLFQKETLTSFSLGNRYIFSTFAKEDNVIVEIYDKNFYTTDSATLLKSDDSQTLITNLVSLTVATK